MIGFPTVLHVCLHLKLYLPKCINHMEDWKYQVPTAWECSITYWLYVIKITFSSSTRRLFKFFEEHLTITFCSMLFLEKFCYFNFFFHLLICKAIGKFQFAQDFHGCFCLLKTGCFTVKFTSRFRICCVQMSQPFFDLRYSKWNFVGGRIFYDQPLTLTSAMVWGNTNFLLKNKEITL